MFQLIYMPLIFYDMTNKMQVKESKWLVKCFLNYLRHDKSEVNVLFDILSIFLFRTRIDFTFLKEFYVIEVCLFKVFMIFKIFVYSFFHLCLYSWLLLYLTCLWSHVLVSQVAEGYEPNMKKTLLLHFLNLFQSKQLGLDHLVVVMQMLILPMLAHAFQTGQSWEVVDTAIIKTIVDKLAS